MITERATMWIINTQNYVIAPVLGRSGTHILQSTQCVDEKCQTAGSVIILNTCFHHFGALRCCGLMCNSPPAQLCVRLPTISCFFAHCRASRAHSILPVGVYRIVSCIVRRLDIVYLHNNKWLTRERCLMLCLHACHDVCECCICVYLKQIEHNFH